MNKKNVIFHVAKINFIIGATMIVPLLFAAFSHEPCLGALAKSILIIFAVNIIVMAVSFPGRSELSAKDGWMIAVLAWISAGLCGCLPYLFSNIFGEPSLAGFINCCFESVSGFTTTGSSVLGMAHPIEGVAKPLLLWRSLTHFLGGLGILVLVVSILPATSSTGRILYSSETSLFQQEKIKPRIRDVAKTLWLLYIGIILAGTLLLVFGGVSFFDAFCNATAAVATGGFSTKDASIAGFNSLYVEVVAMVLMIVGSISFSLHYRAITKGPGNYFRNSQFKWYVSFLIFAVAAIVIVLFANRTYGSIFQALRYGGFQAVSMMSTTGFTTANFENWPYLAQLLLIIFMFSGGMVGSTSGAIKTARIVVLVKYVYREILKIVHPHIFSAIKMDGKVVMKDEIERAVGFISFYIMAFVIATLLVAATGVDIVLSFSSVATTLGGVGPGLGALGAAGNFFALPMFAKCILMLCMILGRLEIFAVMVLFTPAYWKK